MTAALEMHTYTAAVADALDWVDERMPAMVSNEMGRDAESTATLMNKVENVQQDVQVGVD